MSLRRLARQYGARIGAVAALLLLTLLAAPSLTAHSPQLSALIRWFVGALLLPLLILLSLKLAGDALMTRGGTAVKAAGSALAGLAAPVLFTYLFLSNTLAVLSTYIHYARLPGIFTALFVVAAGAITSRYGREFGEPLRRSLTYFGAAVTLYGIAGLASAAYPPLALPFLYAAIGSAIMGAAALVGLSPSLGYVASDVAAISKPVIALFFVLGLAAMLAQVPQLRPYSGYVTTASLVLLLIIVALIGYRLYTSFSRTAEKISERIYEQHVRSSPLVASSDDEALANAISEFLIHGRKDELIAYAAYALAQCDVDYADVVKALSKLMGYKPPQRAGLWPWEVRGLRQSTVRDAELRRAIAAELMDAITKCPQKRRQA